MHTTVVLLLVVCACYCELTKIANGTITTLAGSTNDSPISGASGDGGPSQNALLFLTKYLAVDTGRNRVFISDTFNNKVRVVDRFTGIIDTYVGNLYGVSYIAYDSIHDTLYLIERHLYS